MKIKTRMFVFLLLALALLPGLLYSTRTAYAITTSDLFVCGDPVSGDRIEENWGYNNSTNTLTLYDGFICNTEDENIYAGISLSQNRENALNINLRGAATITGIGIYSAYGSTSNITITGSGSLTINSGTDGIQATGTGKLTIEGGTINSTGQKSAGIYSVNSLEIKGGTVNATGHAGIDVFEGDLNIYGGTVKAEATNTGYTDQNSGLQARKGILNISGGTVEAKGVDYGVTAGAWVDISGGTVTLIGTSKAINNFQLINSITGTGWTDTEGTTGKATISTSEEGQNVSQYKKVVFPADEKVKVTFKVVNGSWNDGRNNDITVELNRGGSLTEGQIPTVGDKPNQYYKAGSWDEVPQPSTVINSDKTFTYTYAPLDPVSVTVTWEPADAGTVTSVPADLAKVPQGTKVTLTASHNVGYVLKEWEVISGNVELSESDETASFTTGSENVEIKAHFKAAPPMEKTVKIYFVNKNTSKVGLPPNIKQTNLSIKIEIKKDGKTVSSVDNVELPVDKETPSSQEMKLSFTPGLDDFDSGVYTFAGTVSPAQLEEDVTSQDPKFAPKTYHLSTRVDPRYDTDKISFLAFYIDWDDGSSVAESPILKVTALPEDEIGAYKIREDGTKEYLIFHTYDICMKWLGKDELCRGYERCFHKESPFVNPFVRP